LWIGIITSFIGKYRLKFFCSSYLLFDGDMFDLIQVGKDRSMTDKRQAWKKKCPNRVSADMPETFIINMFLYVNSTG